MTAFLNDLTGSPVFAFLFAGKYPRQLIIWLGKLMGVNLVAIGNVVFIICEFFILCLILRFITFCIKSFKYLLATWKRKV